jgi:hypothetical protein
MGNLFDIQAEYFDIISELEELEGEITPELEERLKINAKELEFKLKAYYYYVKQNEGNIKTLNDEIERLQNKKVSIENINGRLKEKMKEALLLFGNNGKSGNKQLKYDTINIYNVYHKPLILEVEDEVFMDSDKNKEFIRTKVINTIDKKAVKEAILKGREIEDCFIDFNANYIVLR